MIKLKKLLKEATVSTGVGGFTGAQGDYIDQRLSGPFHPEKNNLKKE